MLAVTNPFQPKKFILEIPRTRGEPKFMLEIPRFQKIPTCTKSQTSSNDGELVSAQMECKHKIHSNLRGQTSEARHYIKHAKCAKPINRNELVTRR